MRRVCSGLRVSTLAPAVVSPVVPLIWVPTCGHTSSAAIANCMTVERSGVWEGYKAVRAGLQVQVYINTCETLWPGSCMGAGAAFDCRRCWGAAARSCCSSPAAAWLPCADMLCDSAGEMHSRPDADRTLSGDEAHNRASDHHGVELLSRLSCSQSASATLRTMLCNNKLADSLRSRPVVLGKPLWKIVVVLLLYIYALVNCLRDHTASTAVQLLITDWAAWHRRRDRTIDVVCG